MEILAEIENWVMVKLDAVKAWVQTKAIPAIRGAIKSWSVWFAALIAALPDILPMLQANFATVAPFIPESEQPVLLRLIALAVLLLRFKTTTSLVKKGA